MVNRDTNGGGQLLGDPSSLDSIKDRTKQYEQNIQQETKKEKQIEITNLELFKSESFTSPDLHVVL